MPTLRLFASAREAAGTARAEIEATTVAELLDKARGQFGERFGRVLDTSRVWVNGQPAEMGTVITGHDIVAVLPPVSGGSSPAEAAARAAPAPAAPSPETPGPATATGPAAPTGPPPESSAPA
ncbi:MAG: sulfur-carrier protein, partial [Actinomycetota bacterium]|nr:sulfur-carrier protein [Actinomycetota bacterium]